MLVGNGFDIHKHSDDEKLVLGGITVEGPGFEAHSDGDLILHALSDALLGSKAKKDLGFYFPSDKGTPKNISSVEMLNTVLEIIEYDKIIINNIDITIISQVINISKISDSIASSIANLLSVDKDLINVKGKSFDNLGVIGEGKASACFAIVSVRDA